MLHTSIYVPSKSIFFYIFRQLSTKRLDWYNPEYITVFTIIQKHIDVVLMTLMHIPNVYKNKNITLKHIYTCVESTAHFTSSNPCSSNCGPFTSPYSQLECMLKFTDTFFLFFLLEALEATMYREYITDTSFVSVSKICFSLKKNIFKGTCNWFRLF